jgi:hypothetical protein
MSAAKRYTAAITGCEHFVFVAGTAVPNRADSMNHVPRRQPIAHGDLGIAGLAAVQRPAFFQQFGARGIVYRAIDAAPAEKRRICRVDDGVNA